MKKLFRISFALIIFAFGILLSQQSMAQPQAASSAEVQAEAQRGGYHLIDLDELRMLYQQESNNLLLVDTRQDWEFYSGHITNAENFPMEPTWLARLTNRGALEQFLGSDKTKTIVFY